MAEEQSIKDQIAAMEKFAIEAKQNISSGKYKEAGESLKNINLQGRKLEWWGSGIKKLPDVFTKELKKEISSARASALEIASMLDKVENFKKKYSDQKEFERKAKSNIDKCKKYVTSMLEMMERAKAVVKAEPWEPINFPMIKTEKWFALLFEQFAKREGYYKKYPENYLLGKIDLSRALLVKVNLWGANLQGANLLGAKLGNANLQGAKLEDANLQRANFEGAYFLNANLKEARFVRANLKGAQLSQTVLTRANFGYADLEGAHFLNADFQNVRDLTMAQLRYALDWGKARNIPRNLK